MGDYTVHAPHTIDVSGAIRFPVHVSPSNLHWSSGTIGNVSAALLTDWIAGDTVAGVDIVVSVKYPVVFIRLCVAKSGDTR